MPSNQLDQTIFAFWDDLNPAAAGASVRARTSGVAPQRSFEVEWRAPHYTGGPPVVVRASLHETSSDITVCYVDTATGTAASDGQSATAGIQGTSSAFLEGGCFGAGLPSGTVLRYNHP